MAENPPRSEVGPSTGGAAACPSLLTHVLGDTTVVRIAGDAVALDEEHALRLRHGLFSLVEPSRRLAVDLGNVRFLTSTAVDLLIGLHRRLAAVGGHLSLCNPTPAVAELF